MTDLPNCKDCGTQIMPGQGYHCLNGIDATDGARHVRAEDCRKALLALVTQLLAENAALRWMWEHREDKR